MLTVLYFWLCTYVMHIFYYSYILLVHVCNYFIQDPPPVNKVTASTNDMTTVIKNNVTTPSSLSGFDIFIMWTVSGLCTCVIPT